MNRIEAINAMLDGKKVAYQFGYAGSYAFFDSSLNRFRFLSTIKGEVNNIENFLDEPDGYSIHGEPKLEDTIRLIINGKTYKAVRDKESSGDE